MMVRGIVLAGAYPNSCALDQLVPRPLLLVAQRPLITYALRWMRAGGLRGATICVNSSARAIQTSVDGSALGLHLDYLEDWTPRGAAGCVRDAGIRTDAESFVVADGTAVPVVDLVELLEGHRASGAVVTIVAGTDPTGRLRPSGVYVFDRRALAFIPEDGFQDIKEKLLPSLYQAGEKVATHMARGVAPRVVNVSTYLALDQWAVEQVSLRGEPRESFRGAGDALVHESAEVYPDVRLLGPVMLGPGVVVRAGATLVGPVSIGSGTMVGEGAVVSRSVVWSNCLVGDGAFVDRSMLANGAHVGTRRSVVSEVRVGDRSEELRRPPSSQPSRAVWGSLLSALSPATREHSMDR
jgi:NDP-sugar pyrophosphorylase family protein